MQQETTIQAIRQVLQDHDVVLYMKGVADMPQCGFSATVVAILKRLGVPFKDVNILQDPVLRQTLKEFSDWPTFPQLYVRGELIGGCDIAREMYQSGELQQLLQEKGLIPHAKGAHNV